MQEQASGEPFVFDLQMFADGGDGAEGADGGESAVNNDLGNREGIFFTVFSVSVEVAILDVGVVFASGEVVLESVVAVVEPADEFDCLLNAGFFCFDGFHFGFLLSLFPFTFALAGFRFALFGLSGCHYNHFCANVKRYLSC